MLIPKQANQRKRFEALPAPDEQRFGRARLKDPSPGAVPGRLLRPRRSTRELVVRLPADDFEPEHYTREFSGHLSQRTRVAGGVHRQFRNRLTRRPGLAAPHRPWASPAGAHRVAAPGCGRPNRVPQVVPPLDRALASVVLAAQHLAVGCVRLPTLLPWGGVVGFQLTDLECWPHLVQIPPCRSYA